MKWFDRWFYSKVRWAWVRGGIEHPDWKDQEDYLDEVAENREKEDFEIVNSSQSNSLGTDPHRLYDGLRIDIKRLNGGYIVTFKHPMDPKSQYIDDDDRKRNSYVVNDNEDFNEKLRKLLTVELLK